METRYQKNDQKLSSSQESSSKEEEEAIETTSDAKSNDLDGWKTAYYSKHFEEERSILKKTYETVTRDKIDNHKLLKADIEAKTVPVVRNKPTVSKTSQDANFDTFPKQLKQNIKLSNLKKGNSLESFSQFDRQWEECKRNLLEDSAVKCKKEEDKMKKKLEEIKDIIQGMKIPIKPAPGKGEESTSFSKESRKFFEEYRDPLLFPKISHMSSQSFNRTQSFPGSRRSSRSPENIRQFELDIPVNVFKELSQGPAKPSRIKPSSRITPVLYKTCVIKDLKDGTQRFSTSLTCEVID